MDLPIIKSGVPNTIGGADKKLDRQRSGPGVRMHDRETVKLFLYAREAARLCGVSPHTARNWAASRRPHSYTGRARPGLDTIAQRRAPREKGPRMTEERGLYDPPASDQIENLLLRAVLADLKAGGWDPASTSTRSKCELGERSGRETGLPLSRITAFLRISRGSYEYHRARLGRDRDADIRSEVRRVFGKGEGAWGYRTVWARLRREGVVASEKRVRRVMREEGLAHRRDGARTVIHSDCGSYYRRPER